MERVSGFKMFMIFFVYCIVSLFYDVFVLSSALCVICHTLMAQYNLFVLKVQLTTNQLTLHHVVVNSSLTCAKFDGKLLATFKVIVKKKHLVFC